MSFFSISISIFLIMNSIGYINAYLELVESIPKKRRQRIIVREMFIALFIMLSFNYLGEGLLLALEVGEQTVLLSGGLILFLIAIRMIFPATKAPIPQVESPHQKIEPFIFPIATPMIAGPSVCTTIMLYAYQMNTQLIVLAILIAWILSITILFFAEQVKVMVGRRALMAIERLMGLLLTMMAMEMLLKGIRYVITNGP